jgi:hypothetical protein
MNPVANQFIPNPIEPLVIPTDRLTKNEVKIFQELIREWTSTPTLDALLDRWDLHKTTTLSMMNDKEEISFLLLNVSSLNAHLAEIFNLLNRVVVPIVVLTGTHHDDNSAKRFSSHFSNFNVFFAKGSNPFGGVLVAVHKSIPTKRVCHLTNMENLIAVDVGEAAEAFQLVACYSPPTEPLPISIFDQLLTRNANTIIMGDFNAKHSAWSRSNENQKGRSLHTWLTSSTRQYPLEVMNRFISTSTRSSATIDLIIAPPHMSSTAFSVLPSIGSDHRPVVWYAPFKLFSTHNKQPVKRTYWTVFELFLTYTSPFWNTLSTSTTEMPVFFSLYERFLSLCTARLTFVSLGKAYKPSLPPHLIDLIKRKRHCLNLFRKSRHPYFANTLREYARIIRRELFTHKRESWRNYCQTLNPLDTKSFWRKAKRHFSSRSSPIEAFSINNDIVSLPSVMCALAKDFYEEQFTQHANTATQIEIEADAADREIECQLQGSRPDPRRITHSHIRRAIASLKNKNSCGVDGVSNRILKLLPSGHVNILVSAFNTFSATLQTPAHWHVAKMILLSKTKSKIVSLDETRPISLLPCFSKIYEKCFLLHFREWINDQGILPEEQSGFRPGHNMAVRLVSIIDQIGQSLSKNTAAAGLFVDFKTAFNQLWYQGLWLKLTRLNCPLFFIAWLRKYLSGRTAHIEIKGMHSPGFHLHKGVPQGSCIGPVLFILFHYDILNSLTVIHWRHLFADDLAILFSPSSMLSSSAMILTLAEQVTDVMNRLTEYSIKWKQEINFKKTYWTLFHRQVAPRLPTIVCDGKTIEHVKKFKYLGTTLDAKLSFTSHIDHIKEKIQKNLNAFKRLSSSRMLSEQVSYRLFNAFIRPYYQSLLNIYPILSPSKQKQLEAMNRRMFRTIHRWFDANNVEIENLPKYASISELVNIHWNKLTHTMLRTNPSVLEEFLQHKMSIIFLHEYLTNPTLTKERREIFGKGRLRNNIKRLITDGKKSLFDHALGF